MAEPLPVNQIILGDCLVVLKTLPDNSVDSIVCDPPYGLGSKEPTGADIQAYLAGSDLDQGGDFMGKDWQIPSVPVWKECFRVVKPGGHLLSFGGTRTFDLIALGIRVAGFESRDTVASFFGTTVLSWLYGCLTADTEILTEAGWVLGTQVGVGDRVAAWDSNTGGITLESVEDKTQAPWDGLLVRFKNDDTDQLLTPNHRVYHRARKRQMQAGKRVSWYDASWVGSEAAEINRWNSIKLPCAGIHDGPGIGGEDYASLLGWVWTEGGFDKPPSTGVRIYQSESANPDKVAEINELIRRLGFDHKRYDRERVYTYKDKSRPYTETCWFFTGPLAQKVRADLPGKHPSWELLWRMTQAEKKAFWDASMKGDGSGDDFYQKSVPDLDWAQTLLALIGQRGKMTLRKPPRDGGSVCVTPRDSTELQTRHLSDAFEHYKGDVWCVKVKTGAFLARRNGKIFVTGNSGFPKSLNISKAIDKMAGAEREVVGANPNARPSDGQTFVNMGAKGHDPFITAPSTDAARQWDGWGTALKPSWEPILVFRKPLAEATVAAQVLATGTGGLNIDATRVITADNLMGGAYSGGVRPNSAMGATGEVGGTNSMLEEGGGRLSPDEFKQPAGRWPANILLVHSEGCKQVGTQRVKAPVINRFDDGMKPFGDGAGHAFTSTQTGDADGMEEVPVYECEDGCPVKVLDRQSGLLKSGAFDQSSKKAENTIYGKHHTYSEPKQYEASVGGASRFFGQIQPDAPFLYTAKVSKSERNRGFNATTFQEGFVMLREDLAEEDREKISSEWPHKADPEWPIRKDLVPAELLGFFDDMKPGVNPHPTLKPLALMTWLVKLVTPRGGVVLDPYCGSGTTCIAALDSDCKYIGIERDPTFHDVALKRVEGMKPELEINAERRSQQSLLSSMDDLEQE